MSAVELPVTELRAADAEAPMVVLVHGLFDSGKSFAPIAERLPDYHVVAYDRRGWGGARDIPRATSLAEHVDDLLHVIGERTVTVVGHSYGGNIALTAAARRPDLVRSLGVFEPTVMWAEWWPDRETQLAQAQAHAQGPPQRVFDNDMVASEWALLRDPPFAWDELIVPCVIGRSTDTLQYHLESATNLSRVLDADVVVFEGAGHTAHRTHPDEFAALVRRAVALRPPN